MRSSSSWALGLGILVLGASALVAEEEAAAPSEHWLTTWPEAEKAAQKDWRPIAIEAGREK